MPIRCLSHFLLLIGLLTTPLVEAAPDYARCIRVVRELAWMNFSPDLRPRVAKIAEQLLARNTTREIAGMPALMLLRNNDVDYATARRMAGNAIAQELAEYPHQYIGPDGSSHGLEIADLLLTYPAPREKTDALGFETRWRIKEVARYLSPLAWIQLPDEERRPNVHLISVYRMAKELNFTHEAQNLLRLMVLTGETTQIIQAAAEQKNDVLLLNIARMLLGDYFQNANSEESEVWALNALTALSWVRTAEYRDLAKRILLDFTQEILPDLFETSQRLRGNTPSRSGVGTFRYREFRSRVLRLALEAMYFTGEPAGYGLGSDGYPVRRFVVHEPNTRATMRAALMELAAHQDLEHFDLIYQTGQAIDQPGLIREYVETLKQSPSAEKSPGHFQLAKAQSLYATQQIEFARRHLVDFILNGYHDEPNASARVFQAIAVAANARDAHALEDFRVAIEANGNCPLLSETRSYLEVIERLSIKPTADDFLREFHPHVFGPPSLETAFHLESHFRALLIGFRTAPDQKRTKAKRKIRDAESYLERREYESALRLYYSAKDRAGVVKVGDAYLQQGDPNSLIQALEAFVVASDMAR
jgi:hypothetical protein